jgi:protein-disulfide isomerase
LKQAVEPAPASVAGLAGTPGASPASGPEDAPVRVYLFTDFQCPVCVRAVEPIKHLARAYPDDVRVIVKQNALVSHPRAARAAAAALAALRQGKFWEFHDRLFSRPTALTDSDLVAAAAAVGLDVSRLQTDMDDDSVTEQVRYETALANSLGLARTPGLIVNGRSQKGWSSYMGLERLVKAELDRGRALAQAGVPADRIAYEATRRSGSQGEQLATALFSIPK